MDEYGSDGWDLSVFLSHRNMNTVYETICERFTELVYLYCVQPTIQMSEGFILFPLFP